MNKKIIVILIAISLIFLSVPAITQAGMGDSLNKTAAQAEYNQEQNLTSLTVTIISALLGLLGLIFVILLIYGGVTWMTAMGQEEKIKKAKKTIINSVIGLLIIVVSYSLVKFIIYLLDQADVIYYY